MIALPVAFALLTPLALPAVLPQQPPSTRTPASVEHWRADLKRLAEQLPKLHIDAFARRSRRDFEQDVARLDQDLQHFSDMHIELRLARLVASLGDSHTGISMPRLTGRVMPLALERWSDGIRIHMVPKEHARLLGGRLVAVGGLPIHEVERRIASVVADESDSWTKRSTRNLLSCFDLLAALEVPIRIGERGLATVKVEVVTNDGNTTSADVAPGPLGQDAARVRPRHLATTLRQGRRWHWHARLPKDGLLYVQYNVCKTSTTQPLDKFVDGLVSTLEQQPVRAVVIDLQYNTGGNSALGDAMFRRLAEKEPIRSHLARWRSGQKNQAPALFCCIGRDTFSSGLLNAWTLRRNYGAVLLGLPTGGTMDRFGEVETFLLEHSKLRVTYSTKRFRLGDVDQAASRPARNKSLEPDHRIESSFADFLAGRDPLLDKVRELALGSR